MTKSSCFDVKFLRNRIFIFIAYRYTNMKFNMFIHYEYVNNSGMNRSLQIWNYKIFRGSEGLGLYVINKFNKKGNQRRYIYDVFKINVMTVCSDSNSVLQYVSIQSCQKLQKFWVQWMKWYEHLRSVKGVSNLNAPQCYVIHIVPICFLYRNGCRT
jgi:hypothetical protein